MGALARHERCVIVMSPRLGVAYERSLANPQVKSAAENSQVIALDHSFYIHSSGLLQKEAIGTAWQVLIKEAELDGYAGFRGCGELYDNVDGAVAYEQCCNQLIASSTFPVSALCVFDPLVISDQDALPLLQEHYYLSTGGMAPPDTATSTDEWFLMPPNVSPVTNNEEGHLQPVFVNNTLVGTVAIGTIAPPQPGPGQEDPSSIAAVLPSPYAGPPSDQDSSASDDSLSEDSDLLSVENLPQNAPGEGGGGGGGSHIPLLHHCLNLLIRQQTAEEVLQARVAERTRELTEERRRLEAEIAIRAQKEAELDRLAQSLEAQVQQRTRELEAALAQAERSSKYKSSFLAQMSHEIRTPLGGVVTTSALLAETDLDPAQRELVDIIHHSASHLQTVINDVLDFEKISSHRLTLTYAAMDPHECIREATQCVTGLIQARSLRLAVEADPALPHLVLADRTRLRQILVNLLSNAAKFTPPEGRIVVRARVAPAQAEPASPTMTFITSVTPESEDEDEDEDEDQPTPTLAASRGAAASSPDGHQVEHHPWDIQVLRDEEEVRAQGGPEEAGRITSDDLAPDRASLQVGEGRPPMALKTIEFSVSDTGCGVPRRLHRFIFRRFRQVLTHSSASRQPGTGLGLSISRNLATGMGGGIGLDSAPEEGRLGSTFTFTIRVLVPQSPADSTAPAAATAGASAQVPSPDMGPATSPQPGGSCCSCSAEPALPSPPSPLIPGLGSAAPVQQPQSGSDGGAGGAAPAGMRVVLVEDNPVNQRVAQLVLGRLNQRPVAVFEHGLLLLQALGVPAQAAQASGGSCEPLGDSDAPSPPPAPIALGPEAGPLVVLLDLSMPVMDGFTTAAHVMQHFPDPATRPILVALTANAIESERQRCLAAGFDFFITKPFSPATLKTLLLQNVPALIRKRGAL
ncbi:putative multi-sensor hybrid histidine kinase [Paratrimastix pyriformis]|uniref:histidine kinase n=1 Tax=Paratrimastix pyriformis TaxID=342808 RepID=A0ABQ8UY28_9EUKA|nr:putative multi-sensor hybrid histidine kinase [Paratrimastix pyriformis]